MSHRSYTALGLTTAALALPAALPSLAAGQDLRSPDARDVTRPHSSPSVDLRSPDARDVTQPHSTPSVDLRSPMGPRAVVPVRIVTVVDDGFDWSDAAIGAGGALGLALLLGGGASTIARRRAGHRVAV